ncbi:ubiquitin specific peptidase 31, putative [Ichthyophthirius multifiliis]|uniref:Ubiquitin specific peptidase 31, putative n=1 Tax=Ichthyophthirius multifiliis TaxID=5932 RepID=G0QK30_ICHMU|nr:ubiquitin specific peptidase 31, putative [Ichthyophthirius multifiliis]EGR34421.1 ubiquitin specific peptidase 31, putative [Ichthyophthirius multifiliis]|eukprot:XP_004039725.1 ubiquitin specific peptidase 31, putative [Ichthyophthirius multifiliis]
MTLKNFYHIYQTIYMKILIEFKANKIIKMLIKIIIILIINNNNNNNNNNNEDLLALNSQMEYLSKNQSIIIDLMQGQYKSKVNCSVCNYSSINFEQFLNCTLPIPLFNCNKIDFTICFEDSNKIDMEESFLFYKNTNFFFKSFYLYIQSKKKLKKKKKINKSDQEILQIFDKNDTLLDQIVENKPVQGNKFVLYQIQDFQEDNIQKILVFIKMTYIKQQKNKLYSTNSYIKNQFTYPRVFNLGLNLNTKEVHLRIWEYMSNFLDNNEDKQVDFYEKKVLNNPQKYYSLKIQTNSKGFYSQIQCFFCGQFTCKNCDLEFSENLKLKEIYEKNKSINENNLILEIFFEEQNTEINIEKIKEIDFPLNDDFDQKIISEQNQLYKPREINIYDCFSQFQQIEELKESNLWFCAFCQKNQKAFKQINLYTTPQVLILHLKRFKTDQDKITKYISFPLQNLDLKDYVQKQYTSQYPFQGQDIIIQPQYKLFQEKNKLVYDLYAVINHQGNLNGGHYTAFAFNQDKWWLFNDSEVKQVNEKDVCTDQAYILFYQKKI